MMSTKIKAGTVVVFSSGEYSGYSVNAVMVATGDITEKEYFEAAVEEFQKEPYKQNRYTVICNLVKMGLLVEVESAEVWLGSYGCLAEEFHIT